MNKTYDLVVDFLLFGEYAYIRRGLIKQIERRKKPDNLLKKMYKYTYLKREREYGAVDPFIQKKKGKQTLSRQNK